MDDIFKEQLIKKAPNLKDTLIKACIITAAFILSFLSLVFLGAYISFLASVAVFAIIFAAYYAFGQLNVEYEYIFTNGELDIDCIYARSRRKRLITVNVRELEIMAHINDKEHLRDFDSATATKDYSSGRVTDNTYAFLYRHKGVVTKFIIEPNDTILKAFGTAMPRRKLFLKV